MLGSPTFSYLFYYRHCACDAIFGLDFRPNLGCAPAHRWIGRRLVHGRR
jgi:hypothetical protein